MGTILSTIILGVSITIGGLFYLEHISPEVALGTGIFCIGLIGLVVNKLRKSGTIRALSKDAPLSGIKVLDLANVVAAPWGATQMGHLGAEVITLENLGLIDSSRGLGSAPCPGMAGLFAVTGRGKQSIIIDLKTDDGLDIFQKLVREVDVVLQNFRPGVADRLGIGYDACVEWNPDVIYLSSSGFGSSGPKSGERIYDPVIQSACGAGDIQKMPTSGEPCLVGNAVVDKISALTNFQAMVAALVARKNGRGGQHIKSAMLDSAMQFFWSDGYMDYTWEGTEPNDKARFLEKVPNDIPGLENDKSLIKSVEQVLEDSEIAKKYIGHAPTLLFKTYKEVSYPIKFCNSSLPNLPPPAMLGEHTNKILKELGYGSSKISEFIKSKSVVSTASLCEMKKDMSKKRIFNIIEDLQTGSANTFTNVKKICDMPQTENTTITGGPLTGYTVVEFSHLACGPMAGMVMADQGARVVKLETKDCLDPSRRIGTNSDKQMGSMFMQLNRNKEFMLLNDNLGDLLANADVFIVDKNLEEKLNINYKIAKKMKKDIIYVRIDKGRGEYYCQAISATAGVQFDSTGENIWVEGLHCEKLAGMLVVGTITSCLYANQGQGEKLEVDLEKSSLYTHLADGFWGHMWDKPNPKTSEFPTCDRIFKFVSTKDDKHLFCGALGDNEFKDLVEVFGTGEGEIKETIEAGKYWKLGERLGGDIEKFWAWWGTIMKKLTYEEYLVLREKAENFSSEVLTRQETLVDEQVKHSQIIQQVVHPTLGSYTTPKPAANFLGTPCSKIIKPARLPGANV